MLITLIQNQSTNVYLTLREKSLLWLYSSYTPYYLFVLTNPSSNSSITFTAPNLAPLSAQDSYDQFLITTTGHTHQNFSAGTITLNPGVFWDYTVYEQQLQYNFALSGTTSIVERGKVMFSAATQDFSYRSATGDTGYVFFNTYN